MTLLEELKERADKLDAELLALSGRIKEVERESNELHTCINALDIAEMDAEDAALEPTSIVNTDEGWELEPALIDEPETQPELFDEPQEIEASSQSESCVPALGAETDLQTSPGEAEESRDQFDDEAELAAAIELTADVEPEPEFIELDQETCEPVQPQWNEPQPTEKAPPEAVGFILSSKENPLNQTQGYAPVVDNAEAHIQAVEAERYAQPTNPDADFWARGLAPSGPEKKHRFSIFGNKRETEDA